ncbi:hypothetical protein B5X24_HaOG211785 [Helicoverpa armigera]|uniref:Uncharacterized protein n=1 Tax=Helicoverpa armigera TaxID=29058 RepID=A0A2W1BEF4_HELAM|nr:hypothetical protein B5X24_HaOG211785 [Helicoverpa armigera]
MLIIFTAQSRPTCSSCVTEPCRCGAQVNGTVEVPDNIVQQTAASSQPTNINTTPKSNRFGFKRLFGRQASIPYLDTKDSSITADTTQEKQKIPQAENNDGCRIT